MTPLTQSEAEARDKRFWAFALQLLRAQQRMLNRWSEGDDTVKQQLWRDLHERGEELLVQAATLPPQHSSGDARDLIERLEETRKAVQARVEARGTLRVEHHQNIKDAIAALSRQDRPEGGTPELVEYFRRQCNRYTNGQCSTRRCLLRGGWDATSPPDFSKATCEEHEAAAALSPSQDRSGGVDAQVYESAVKGRSDFRLALSEARKQLKDAFQPTDDELRVIGELGAELDLSPGAVIRQALRFYQVVHVRGKAGETFHFSGDAQRAAEFAGLAALGSQDRPAPVDEAAVERVRLARELAAYLPRVAQEAEENGWHQWGADIRDAARTLSDLIAALTASPLSSDGLTIPDELRPVETAPKDGSYFLFVGSNFDGGMAVVQWDADLEWWTLDDGKNPEIALRHESDLIGWLPLPKYRQALSDQEPSR